MKKVMKYATYLWMAVIACFLHSCADEIVNQTSSKEGSLLNLYMEIEGAVNTRLAELPHDKIGTEAGLMKYKNVGLYIYYEDDYKDGDLSKPYIRNLEMTYDATNKKLVATGTSQDVYIYDRMTIVALYPYNKDAKDFVTANDEESYYFSESDYKDQLYIPYRACENINPTNAYTARLLFSPKQTCKVQIVLTTTDPNKFPTYDAGKNKSPKDDASIIILPNVDPVTTGNYAGVDRREQWIDYNDALPKDDKVAPVAGGKYVRRYNAYLWTTKKDLPHHDNKTHWDNIINKGDILFHSDKLTLVVPATVNLSEQKVYRYGYDLDNGEMFIPTSESLVYDATSLQTSSLGGSTYQVCDIDLSESATEWETKDIYDATYDGGGHKITGLKIDATMTQSKDGKSPGTQAFGLFGSLSGTSKLKNIHLVEPEITVNGSASKDTCFVGALCATLNPELSLDDKKKKIMDALPPELSIPVKEALVAEAMRNSSGTTCTIEGCKVENPKITVSNATVVIAGGFCGRAGNQAQIGNITESYLAQTSDDSFIKVNDADADWQIYKTIPNVGSFCGLLEHGTIDNSYTTMNKNVTASYNNGNVKTEAAVDFCYQVKGQTVKDCRTTATAKITTKAEDKKPIIVPNILTFASSWVSWTTFVNTGTAGGDNPSNSPFNKWPCVSWKHYWVNLGSAPTTYPTLMWEYKPYLVNE